MIVTSVTLHPFQGNPSERQLSFPAGESVTYDTAHSSQAGWVWATLASTGSTGWCPQTYLAPPETVPLAPPPASAAPILPASAAPIAPAADTQQERQNRRSINSATSQPHQSSGEASFDVTTPAASAGWAEMKQVCRKSWLAVSNGAQAVGTAVSNGAQVAGANASQAFVNAKEGAQDLGFDFGSATSQQSQSSSGEVPLGGADFPSKGNRLMNIGNNVRQAGQKSWVAVSNGAQVAEAHVSQAFVNAKEGVQDLQQKQQAVSSKPMGQRSVEEQRAVDTGNYAARGAVVNGIYHGVISGGNPIAAARGAARGGAFGAAWGFTKQWKPCG